MCRCGNNYLDNPEMFEEVTADGCVVSCMICGEIHDVGRFEGLRDMEV